MSAPSYVLNRMGVHKKVDWLISRVFAGSDGITAALLFGAGTSADPVTITEADKNFIAYYTETSATSGDTRQFYLRHKMSGAGGYGDTIRVALDVAAAGGIANADAIHATVALSTTAAHQVAGQAQAIRATFEAGAATRTIAGHCAALLVDSNIGANNTAGANVSFIRVADAGSVKITNLFELPTVAAKTAYLTDVFVARHADATATHGIKIVDYAGTSYWIMVTTDTPND